MSEPAQVLIVEDERGLREGLLSACERLGYQGLPAAGLAEARQILSAHRVACVLLDIRLKDGDGLEFLAELQKGPMRSVPVIIATAYGDSERTIRAMRDGAFDYVTKPFHLPTLLASVERAVKQRALTAALPPMPLPPDDPGGLVGTSAAMLATWKLIGRAAATLAPVLITGETGVGKELVARAIHGYSERKDDPFVAVNIAALPEGLLESELFGHEKGAFTGAAARRAGRFELAARGTLFLDEIGDLDASLQTKLLRVLQDGRFERVGGQDQLQAHARVLTATNKPVRPGEAGCVLREELYYRLAVVEILVPPLRARKSDIPQLVAHALRRTATRAVSEAAMQRLLGYDWPGNVRELIHVVERAAVLSGGEVIDVANLPESLNASPTGAGTITAQDAAEATLTLRDAVARLERRLISQALARAGGNRSEAARQLGIGRAQLYAKLDEHGLSGTSHNK
ncbi:MAG: sigma-54 dependent transcriptional regulator [Polyangiaceae bacterium]